MKRKLSADLQLHMLLIPGLIVVFIFQYIPVFGIAMAFQNYVPTKGVTGSKWVGMQNFEFIFSLPDTMQVLWNTLLIAVMKIAAGLLVPIATALMLNEVIRPFLKRSIQTLIYIPHFLSWIILGGILIDLLSPSQGMVNRFLSSVGIEPIYFLGDNRWFPATLVISNEWKEFGFSTIVYLAALTSINPTLYEAAAIDGAGHWRRMWHVTLPGMRPIIILLATLSLGQILNAGFEQVFVLYSPQVYASGDIIDTMVYRMGLENAQYSLAAAVGLFKSVISLILISVSYWLAYRLANYRIF